MPSRKNLTVPAVLFFVFLALYVHNLSRSVFGGDVGDLITASSVMGVAHPPGYPLFTFLGFILTRINFISPAFMTGLISALASSFSIVFFYFISLHLTKNKAISVLSSLILGLNYLFWFYSEIAEVFALNIFFALLLFLLALYLNKTKNKNFFFALSFVAGISLTNHQTIILIAPAIFILAIKTIFSLIKNPKNILLSVLFFVLGLSVYIYVPIASMHNPVVNWDNVKDLNSFLKLMLRKDYGTFSAGAFVPPTLMERFVISKVYVSNLVSQLTIPVIIFSVLGLLYGLFKRRIFSFSVLLGFLVSGPLFVVYAGFPLLNGFYIGVYERFFILSAVVLLLFIPLGFVFWINLWNKIFKKKTYEMLFLGILIIIPLSLFYYNFPKTDLHNVYIGDRLGYDFLTPLPKNTVLIMGGDTGLFNLWYVHYALNFRPDVEVINFNGLQYDYFYNLEKEKFLKKHPKENRDENILFPKIVDQLFLERPVYSYIPIQNKTSEQIYWVPQGLAFRMVKGKDNFPSKEAFLKKNLSIISNFKKPSQEETDSLAVGSYTISDVPSIYADSFLSIGNFILTNYKDNEATLYFFNLAKNISKDYHKVYEVLGIYYFSQKNCVLAKDNLNKAIELYPFEKLSYYILYANYVQCFRDKISQAKVVRQYQSVFKSDFMKDLKGTLEQYK